MMMMMMMMMMMEFEDEKFDMSHKILIVANEKRAALLEVIPSLFWSRHSLAVGLSPL
jgi:hypothetical protein